MIRMTCRKIYEVYNGDNVLIAVGTAPEVAGKLDICENTVRWYAARKRKKGHRYAVSYYPEKEPSEPVCHHGEGRSTTIRIFERKRYGVPFKSATCEVCGRRTDYCVTSKEARERAALGLWEGWKL